ncbi:MAG: hypothetical protein JRF41_05600 [Deltaproteobacteria bacterium]|nr:hypothetical protein [Deltaproteobacteria bacterium]
MRFDYITGNTERSLSPFFSPLMISMTFNSVWILGLILLVVWPTKDLFRFFQGHTIPLTFLVVTVATLLINTYLGLRCGRGEVFPNDYFSRLARMDIKTFEEDNNFFTYGLVAFIIHSIFLLALVLPFLVVSAAISGITLPVFAKSFSILFASSLLCRMFAFLMYLVFGKWSLSGYLFARGFVIFFVFITASFAAFVNPILLIYSFYQGRELLPHFWLNAYGHFILIVTSAILILTLANQAMIKRNRGKAI